MLKELREMDGRVGILAGFTLGISVSILSGMVLDYLYATLEHTDAAKFEQCLCAKPDGEEIQSKRSNYLGEGI